jgi:tetratricopeptide (TPR) repeat protein
LFSIPSVLKTKFQTDWKIPPGKVFLPGLVLMGVVVWVFLPSLGGDFIDRNDFGFVTKNVHIHLTLANVVWVFSHPFDANWLPVTLGSFMLDHQLYGLKPWGYHLTNVLLHALNTVLVFWVLRRMTGATWRSLMVAALFGLHPLRVESVAWISERKDVLSVTFWMLTLWAYARYAQGRSRVECRESSAGNDRSTLDYCLALLFFALGLMSKPMMVTLPGALLLLDYWPLARWPQHRLRGLLVEKIPFFLLSAGVSVATYVTQKNADMMSNVLTGLSLSFGARLENALVSYGRYLGKLFWPVNLCALYPYPEHWPGPAISGAGLLVLGLSVWVFVRRRQQPYLLTGWLWYLGTLVPVLGLVPVGAQAMADRYSYIPSLGILMMVVWGTCQLTRTWHYQGIGLGAAGGVLVLVCIVLTRHQIGYWKDDLSVWQRAVAVTGNNYDAHNMLGRAWFSRGRMDEAIPEFQEVVRLNPGFAEPYCSLGRSFEIKGQMDEAIAWYQKALENRPDYVTVHNNLATLLIEKGQADEAMVHSQKALASEPYDITAHDNLGLALALKGRFDEALAYFQKAVELQPDNGMAQLGLGSFLLRLGRTDEAIRHLHSAVLLQPDDAETHNNLGGALLSKGNVDDAVCQFQEAARLQPDRFEVHHNLGHALLKQGSLDAAIREFQTAFHLKPDNVVASNDLVMAVGMKEKPAQPPVHSTKP